MFSNEYKRVRENNKGERCCLMVVERIMELKGLGILSFAKFFGFIGFLMGAFYGILVFIWSLVAGAAFAASLGDMTYGFAPPIIGLVIGLMLPFAVMIASAIHGAIIAILYNIIAAIVGGVSIKLRE